MFPSATDERRSMISRAGILYHSSPMQLLMTPSPVCMVDVDACIADISLRVLHRTRCTMTKQGIQIGKTPQKGGGTKRPATFATRHPGSIHFASTRGAGQG